MDKENEEGVALDVAFKLSLRVRRKISHPVIGNREMMIVLGRGGQNSKGTEVELHGVLEEREENLCGSSIV